jgi:aryl-alcohol dehydrogenase-like predicted oxidoreductase
MRLSTDRERDQTRAIAVLHAAFDAGVNVLDTADAYCWNDSEVGHNERLIAAALSTWTGDRSRILVATKGGLTRPQGGWIADGRARHLTAACEASRRALGVERIPLYQLHAPDPRTPLSTSVRALASLQRDGLIESIGLCNVNVGQIEEAQAIAEIASVQVELSVWHDEHLLSGVVDYCVAHGIHLLAHRPLGGPQRHRRTFSDPVLSDLAARHRATPFEIALAWLSGLSPLVLPLPGATRAETAQSIARARRIALTDEDRARLDERVPAGRARRLRKAAGDRHEHQRADAEVVLIMGLPAAGKSTVAETFIRRGYVRLNRDETGGTLGGLLPGLDSAIAARGDSHGV